APPDQDRLLRRDLRGADARALAGVLLRGRSSGGAGGARGRSRARRPAALRRLAACRAEKRLPPPAEDESALDRVEPRVEPHTVHEGLSAESLIPAALPRPREPGQEAQILDDDLGASILFRRDGFERKAREGHVDADVGERAGDLEDPRIRRPL